MTVDTRAAVLLEASRFIRDPESKFDAHHLIAWVPIGSKQWTCVHPWLGPELWSEDSIPYSPIPNPLRVHKFYSTLTGVIGIILAEVFERRRVTWISHKPRTRAPCQKAWRNNGYWTGAAPPMMVVWCCKSHVNRSVVHGRRPHHLNYTTSHGFSANGSK
jgi:hypothetical protein